MKTKLLNKRELADAWPALEARAKAQGILIGNRTNGCGVTRFYAYKEGDILGDNVEMSHFGGLYDFNVVAYYAACEALVRRQEVQKAWNRRQHKRAISRAYEGLCDLAESIGIPWCVEDGSAIACDIIINPSDPAAGLEIISTPDGLVELHAENLPTIGGKPSRRWNYTVVTVHGGGSGHDDPPPTVEESKPLSLGAAIRQFAIAVLTNRISFSPIDL